MRKFFLSILFVFFCTSNANAKMTTKQQTDNFLERYCIEIVNGISDAYDSQLVAINTKDWKTFGEKGRWIGGLADVYSKICK